MQSFTFKTAPEETNIFFLTIERGCRVEAFHDRVDNAAGADETEERPGEESGRGVLRLIAPHETVQFTAPDPQACSRSSAARLLRPALRTQSTSAVDGLQSPAVL